MGNTSGGSYLFDQFVNREEESLRLKKRAAMRIEGLIPLLKRHGMTDNMKVLEVGCGHGIRTNEMARHFTQSEIHGIDLSISLLEEARKSSLANVKYTEGNAEALPLPSASMDFVYSRLVFMHLKNPLAVIKEVKRVLRPGGTFMIEDADRDFMNFHPAPSTWNRFWKNIQAGQRLLGGDPNVGRKLESYLKLSSFNHIQLELQPIHGKTEEVLELCQTLMPALNEYLPLEERSLGYEAIKDLEDLCHSTGVSLYHLWFVISGRVL